MSVEAERMPLNFHIPDRVLTKIQELCGATGYSLWFTPYFDHGGHPRGFQVVFPYGARNYRVAEGRTLDILADRLALVEAGRIYELLEKAQNEARDDY